MLGGTKVRPYVTLERRGGALVGAGFSPPLSESTYLIEMNARPLLAFMGITNWLAPAS